MNVNKDQLHSAIMLGQTDNNIFPIDISRDIEYRYNKVYSHIKKPKKSSTNMIKIKENAKDRCERLIQIRELSSLTRTEFAQKLGFSDMNMIRLEKCSTLIKMNVAERISYKCLEQLGILVDAEWIMSGHGQSPYLHAEYYNINMLHEDTQEDRILYNIIQQLKLSGDNKSRHTLIGNAILAISQLTFTKQYAISMIVNDRKMEDIYMKGDRIMGYWMSPTIDNLLAIHGNDCIVQKDNNLLMVRRIFISSDYQYATLVCHNTSYAPETLLLNNIKIGKIITMVMRNI